MRHGEVLNKQQRQIDQIYWVTLSLIQRATPAEQQKIYDFDKLPAGKYKMYFANYRTNSAMLIWLDSEPTKRHEEELVYVYTTRLPQDILNTWTHGEVRRIPEE
ncbi:MAG: hypothetical protein AAB509_00335 [Patescibacteria group bacterium]